MKDLQIIQNDDGVFDVYDDTYDITIHCTSQEEQDNVLEKLNREKCEDAISRELALEKMADYVASGYADSAEDFEEYSKIICQLPPVKPAEKTGHWIDHQEDRWIYAKCSECETVHDTRTNYCPHCGEKMGR